MPQPADVEGLAAALAALYADVWDRIQTEERELLAAWPALPRHERHLRLRELQHLVAELRATVDEQALRFVVEDLPAAYLAGALATVGSRAVGVDVDAIAVLAQDTYSDLLAATQHVEQTTKTLLRTLSREHITDKLLTGQTAQQAAADLAERLAGHGISAITYRNGARHGLADYADLVARTKTAVAYSTGNLAGATAGGVHWVEVLDNPACGWRHHDDRDKPNGTVRPVQEALAHVISHPRCVRSFAARPDVQNAEQARRATGSPTAAQNADQAQVARARELAASRRAATIALQRRAHAAAVRLIEDHTNRITSPSHARRIAARQVRTDRASRLERRDARLARRRASRSTQDGT